MYSEQTSSGKTKKTEVEWREEDGTLKPYIGARAAVWAPQSKSQRAFLDCPCYEVLYTGTRGNGKSDALIMDFAKNCGQGFGQEWRGILFRRTYAELRDIVAKMKKWFPQIFPTSTFNESKMTWLWPDGENLRLSYMSGEQDYWAYHGHSYPWIGWEELTTWADDKCYRVMMSTSRSTVRGMPMRIRSTTNPYGPGHNWVKARFQLPVPHGSTYGKIIQQEDLPPRVAVHGYLAENQILLYADPDYIIKLKAAARNPSEYRAWIYGDWNIVAGGMFDDLWSMKYHVVPNIPFSHVPRSWKINRSYDHGQSKPFSVGWWAQSSGEPLVIGDYTLGPVPGDLFRIAEWYGWDGKSPNEGIRMLSTRIADGILQRERDWGIKERVRPGPADTQIFTVESAGRSVAADMRARGVRWGEADKRPGSRKAGWEQLRKYLANAIPGRDGTREGPGLFACQRCSQFIRTFPVLPRCEKDLDDVDTEAEDHIADEVRYRVRENIRTTKTWSW